MVRDFGIGRKPSSNKRYFCKKKLNKKKQMDNSLSGTVQIQSADILANLSTQSGYSALYSFMKGSFTSRDGATQTLCVHHYAPTQLWRKMIFPQVSAGAGRLPARLSPGYMNTPQKDIYFNREATFNPFMKIMSNRAAIKVDFNRLKQHFSIVRY